MSAPAASVLIPCFRSGAFLARALDSLLAQTFPDWEAVVVDNASDDGTYDLAREYARRDPRVKAHRNAENLGPLENWRRAAALARGRHAALLFSDDWYAPELLAEALPHLEDPRVGFVQSAVRLVTDPARPAAGEVRFSLGAPAVRPTAEFLRLTYRRVPGSAVPVSPGCAVLRRGDLARYLALELPDAERLGWSRHGAGPDVAVYLQACLEHEAFAHLSHPRVSFLSHGGNLSWRPEVGRAYAVALARFLDEAEGRMGGPGKPRAQLAARLASLGEEDLSRRVAARLGLVGRLHLANERRLSARAVAAARGGK